MTTHELKVEPPHFDALMDGSKTFEVRKNDRGFQAGDALKLWDFDPGRCGTGGRRCKPGSGCPAYIRSITRRVTFVYSGDPRFGGIEPGFVVLGIEASGE